jgi:hypothetical protein
MLPYLMWFLIPVVARLPANKLLTAAFLALGAFSLVVHWQGATAWPCYAWSMDPVDVNLQPSRLWDFTDPPFLRGFRR